MFFLLCQAFYFETKRVEITYFEKLKRNKGADNPNPNVVVAAVAVCIVCAGIREN
jgi:hypothetical protein